MALPLLPLAAKVGATGFTGGLTAGWIGGDVLDSVSPDSNDSTESLAQELPLGPIGIGLGAIALLIVVMDT